MNDLFMLTVCAGLTGGIIKIALSLIFYYTGLITVTEAHLGALLLFPAATPGPDHLAVGALLHLVVAAFLGAVFFRLLKIVGPRYLIWKGLIYGASLWAVFFGLFAPMVYTQPLLDIPSAWVSLLTNLSYGAVTAAIVHRAFAKA